MCDPIDIKIIKKRRYIENLYERSNGLCHWCGLKTVLTPQGYKSGHHFDRQATVDHLNNRLYKNKRRKPNTNHETRRVLSCYKCNLERGFQEEQEFYIKKYMEKICINNIDFHHGFIVFIINNKRFLEKLEKGCKEFEVWFMIKTNRPHIVNISNPNCSHMLYKDNKDFIFLGKWLV